MSTSSNAMLDKLRQYGGLSSQQAEALEYPLWAGVALFRDESIIIKTEDIGRFTAHENDTGDFWVGENDSRDVSITVPYTASSSKTGSIEYKRPRIFKARLDVYTKAADATIKTKILRLEANILGKWTVEGTVSGVYTVTIPENVLLVPVDPF